MDAIKINDVISVLESKFVTTFQANVARRGGGVCTAGDIKAVIWETTAEIKRTNSWGVGWDAGRTALLNAAIYNDLIGMDAGVAGYKDRKAQIRLRVKIYELAGSASTNARWVQGYVQCAIGFILAGGCLVVAPMYPILVLGVIIGALLFARGVSHLSRGRADKRDTVQIPQTVEELLGLALYELNWERVRKRFEPPVQQAPVMGADNPILNVRGTNRNAIFGSCKVSHEVAGAEQPCSLGAY